MRDRDSTTGSVSVLDEPSNDAGTDDKFYTASIWVLIVLVGSILWLGPMGSSLWLDELVTWWLIKDSLADTFHRAYTYQGQSVLYYPMEWVVRHASSSEWFLRLPSLVFMAAAAFLLYRLARKLSDREAARTVTLIFVLWPTVVFEASNARPYALATFATVAATSALARWLDDGSWRWAIGYALLGGVVAYTHILFALVLPCHVIYVFARSREGGTPVRLRTACWIFGAVVLIDTPLVVQLLQLLSRRGSLTLPGALTVDWLGLLLVPSEVVVGMLLGGALAWLIGDRICFKSFAVQKSTTILVISGMLIPVLTLSGLALFTDVRLLETRYAMAAAPFGAAFFGGLIRTLGPQRLRWIMAVMVVLFSALALKSTSKRGDDWRWGAEQADQLATPTTAVFIRPGLIESTHIDWFSDPERSSYLMAPTSYYHFEGRLVPLPFDVSSDADSFVASEISSLPPSIDRIVTVNAARDGSLRSYIAGRLEVSGWALKLAESHEYMVVEEWERPSS